MGMRRVGALVLAALVGSAPAAAADWVYQYRDDTGARAYSDRKPAQGGYVQLVRYGRPTASASCFGVTEQSLRARAANYEPLIRKYAAQYRVSANLVSALMRVESCYDARAVSRSGAQGLMQLMPATAIELGVRDSFDPEQNIEGGVRYFAQMMRRFNHDVRLALAAYNAGPGAVAQHDGVPPYPHTTSYVKRILKLYRPEPVRTGR